MKPIQYDSTAWPLILTVVIFSTHTRAQTEPPSPLQFKLAYSTLFGGSDDEGAREVIPYADGSVLISGHTSSSDMPVTPNAFQQRYAGELPDDRHRGIYTGDCFLARLNPEGNKLVFSTYFGGSKQERTIYGMTLDPQGNILITTTTRSPDLPTTENAFQRRYGGGAADITVAKFTPDGSRLIWCTYIGGSGDETPRGGFTTDPQGYIYVVGTTTSHDFPTGPNATDSKNRGGNDAVLVKLRPDGSGLALSTLFGGSGWDGCMGIRTDQQGNLYIAGHTQSPNFPVTPDAPQPTLGGLSDCFIAKYSPDARQLLYATYIGGSKNEFAEHRLLIAPDQTIWVSGFTQSHDFPTTPNAFQKKLPGKGGAFLTAARAGQRTFMASTVLGGSGNGFCLMPTADSDGNIYIVGQTSSPDFPVTPNALQTSYAGGTNDGVLAVFSPDLSKLLYATYLGGAGDDLVRSIAFGSDGAVYLVGLTTSTDFPTTPDALKTTKRESAGDAFVIKLVPAQPGDF